MAINRYVCVTPTASFTSSYLKSFSSISANGASSSLYPACLKTGVAISVMIAAHTSMNAVMDGNGTGSKVNRLPLPRPPKFGCGIPNPKYESINYEYILVNCTSSLRTGTRCITGCVTLRWVVSGTGLCCSQHSTNSAFHSAPPVYTEGFHG